MTSDGMSGVAASNSTDAISVRLKNRVASAARFSSFRISTALFQTNQLAGSDSTRPAKRTPSGVSPNKAVPAWISHAIAGGWSK